MITKDQRIARLRDALDHIRNASCDADYDAAPAWAAAALAEDDSLAKGADPLTASMVGGIRFKSELPAWFKPEHRLLAAGPLLQACAEKGMTAAQALDQLAKQHEKLFAHTISLADLGPSPEVVGALDGDEVLAVWREWFADATAGETIADLDTHED